VQDVFVRSAERIRTLPEVERRAYLRAAVVNAWRNERRHRRVERRWLRSMRRDALEDEPDLEGRDALWAQVAGLPERQRACVVLRYHEDLPETEMARLLVCRVGTVKSQLSRALAKLRMVVER
jgi:RNA polymerase sigma factor (sigma-70 family)